MTYITAAGTYALGSPAGLYLEINNGFTGTITLADARGTFAIINNPTTVANFRYYGLQGAVTAVVSGTLLDATASSINHAL